MKKYFKLDSQVNIPKDVNYHQIGENYLGIAKEKPNWLSLNKLEHKILQGLNKGYTLRDSLFNLIESNMESEIISSAQSLLEKIENNQFYEDAENELENPVGGALHYYTTNICNLKCKHCYRDAGKFKGELTTSEVKKMLSDFSKTSKGIISLTGGEPLMRKDFFEIAEYGSTLENSLLLFTNGTLITKENAKPLSKFFDEIQISLDGATAEVNDNIRGKGSYNKIIDGINNMPYNGAKVNVSMVVTPENAEDIKLNLKKLLNEKIKNLNISIRLGGLINYGRAECAEKGNSNSLIEDILEDFSKSVSFKKSFIPRNVKNDTCGYSKALTVNYDGEVYPCPITQEGLNIGNVKNVSMNNLIEKLNEISYTVSVYNMEECKTCDLKFICAGGCRIKNMNQNGSFIKPRCDNKHKEGIYKQLLKF